MDFDSLKLFYTKNELRLKILAVGVICFLVILCIYNFLVRPYSKKAAQAAIELVAAEAKSAEYKNFDQYAVKLASDKVKVSEILQKSEFSLVNKTWTSQNSLDEISNICEKLGLKLDRIRTTKIGEKDAWAITFKANLALSMNFISYVEKYFRIDSIKIKKVSEDIKYVDLELSSILDSTAPESEIKNENIDLFDMSKKINEIVSAVEEQQNMLNAYAGAKRDIFADGNLVSIPLPVVNKAKQVKEKDDFPEINLDGIIFGENNNSAAIINGETVRKNQVINGVKVIDISEKRVVVEWHSKRRTLKLNK